MTEAHLTEQIAGIPSFTPAPVSKPAGEFSPFTAAAEVPGAIEVSGVRSVTLDLPLFTPPPQAETETVEAEAFLEIPIQDEVMPESPAVQTYSTHVPVNEINFFRWYREEKKTNPDRAYRFLRVLMQNTDMKAPNPFPALTAFDKLTLLGEGIVETLLD